MAEIIIPQGWILVTASTQAEVEDWLPDAFDNGYAGVALHLKGMREAIKMPDEFLPHEFYVPTEELVYWCDSGLRYFDGLGWLIVSGGERPLHPAWVRSLRDQCQEAGVPFCFTGWGEWQPGYQNMHEHVCFCDNHLEEETHQCPDCSGHVAWEGDVWRCDECGWVGSDPDDSTECPNCEMMAKVGAAKSSRTLDGKIWDEKPKELTHDAR